LTYSNESVDNFLLHHQLISHRKEVFDILPMLVMDENVEHEDELDSLQQLNVED
jgi:hypothetical protein